MNQTTGRDSEIEREAEELLAMPAEQHLLAAARIWVQGAYAHDATKSLLRALLHAQFAAVKTAINQAEDSQPGIQPPLTNGEEP